MQLWLCILLQMLVRTAVGDAADQLSTLVVGASLSTYHSANGSTTVSPRYGHVCLSLHLLACLVVLFACRLVALWFCLLVALSPCRLVALFACRLVALSPSVAKCHHFAGMVVC